MRTARLVAAVGAIAICLPPSGALARPSTAASRPAGCPPAVTPPRERLIERPGWLSNVLITEYYPAPERWFDGRLVSAPGLPGRHRIDWLYGASGLAMQGEGIGANGRMYHFAGPYALTWRNSHGQATLPCTNSAGAWSNGPPAWIGRTWLNHAGAVTYPLGKGAWSDDPPARLESSSLAARFAPGASLPLSYWHDVAVDPGLIPHGSSLFVPAYCGTPSDGWFTAADTGGAIIGRHIDVFRSPPAIPWSSRLLRRQRIYVVPPGFARPRDLRCPS